MVKINSLKRLLSRIFGVIDPSSMSLSELDRLKKLEEQRHIRVWTKLILAELVLFTIAGIITLFWKDWYTLSAVGIATVLQVIPLCLIKHRSLQAGGVLFVVINIVITTAIAMVGQGIFDLAIVALPIIFVFAGLGLNRRSFIFCVILGITAVCWLVVGENTGLIVPRPLPDDPSHVFYLAGLVTMLLVAAFAVNVLVTNLNNSLLLANQEILKRKQMEEALQNSEYKLKEAQIAGKIGYWEYDLKTQQIMWSDQTFRLYERDKLLGPPSLVEEEKYYSKEDVAQLKEYTKIVTKSGNQIQYDLQVQLPSGKVACFSCNMQPTKGDDGQITGLFGTVLDITERKKMEDEVHFSNAAFRSIHEAVFAMDTDFIVTHWNAISEMLFGIQASDAIGKPIGQLLAMVESYPGQNYQRMADLISKRFNHEEQVYRTPKGEIWVDVHTQAIENEGQITGWVTLAMDISNRKKSEEILRESEERYRTLIAASPSGIIQTDLEGRIIYASPKMISLVGYENASAAIGCSPLEWITPEDRDRAGMNLNWIKQGKNLGANYYRISKADQTYFWGELNTSILRDQTGTPIGMMSVVSDITERKQAEDEIKWREQRARTLLIASNDMAHIIDEDGIILEVNEVMATALKVPKDKLVGMCVYDRYPGKNAERRKQLVNQVIHEQKQLRFFDEQNGKVYESNISPIATAAGEKRQVVVFARDITERIQSEISIKRAAEEWRTTFDSITEPISIIDKEFKLLRVNKAFADMYGKEPGDIIGSTCYELVHKTTGPVSRCPHLQTLTKGLPYTEEIFEPTTNRNLEVSTSPIFNQEREVVSSVHITRDITDRRQLQEQLMLTDRLASIGELAAGIAHELNNPLTSIMGLSELVMEKEISQENRENLSIINRESQRAARIVKDLLTFARKHAPIKQPTKLSDIIEDVLRIRAYEHKVNNIEVITRYDDHIPEIMVDYFQIQQVCINLIINAEYFMLQNKNWGTLIITAKNTQDRVQVSFTDDGPGIPPENLNKIFDPFFTTKEVGKGTGLGLSICHGIMTEHGGRIYANSENGKGAIFILEFPVEVLSIRM